MEFAAAGVGVADTGNAAAAAAPPCELPTMAVAAAVGTTVA